MHLELVFYVNVTKILDALLQIRFSDCISTLIIQNISFVMGMITYWFIFYMLRTKNIKKKLYTHNRNKCSIREISIQTIEFDIRACFCIFLKPTNVRINCCISDALVNHLLMHTYFLKLINLFVEFPPIDLLLPSFRIGIFVLSKKTKEQQSKNVN